MKALAVLKINWPEYLLEAWGLGLFMVFASLFASLLESRYLPIIRFIPDPDIRRCLMGLAMGLTAILLIYSPWGKRSGAHYNPAVTLAFLRQGKVKPLDALFYIFAQFFGGTLGMLLMAFIIGKPLTEAPVSYVVTQPGQYGVAVAFAAELMMSTMLMLMVLRLSNSITYNRYTGVCAGCLVAFYITCAAPISGMSINPARSFASAFAANHWSFIWVYFTAPVIGMQMAIPINRLCWQNNTVNCAKLVHSSKTRCIHCGYNPLG